MATIKLIVTGDLERLVMHESLGRVFPSQLPCGEDVVWQTPHKLNCATSARLAVGARPSTAMKALANAMFMAVGIGKEGIASDFVIVIDDVEIGNTDRMSVVAAHFKSAVRERLDEFPSLATRTRYEELLRNKCSFHLLNAMVETYFFADEATLRVAGVSKTETPQLSSQDVEDFVSVDLQWRKQCERENERRRLVHPWWTHERHAKHYLEHLTERGGVFYEETNHGKLALSQINWAGVPKLSQHAPVVRALFEDIADWFHTGNPLGRGSLDANLYPASNVNRAGLLLRNM